MIKASTLLYAPSGTGKTTQLQRIWDHDHGKDLAINLNRSYRQIKHGQADFKTRPYLVTPDRKTSALSLSGSPLKWAAEINAYRKQHPVIKHLMIDEVQCAESVYLTQIIMLVRAIYHVRVPVVMCGLMHGVINGKDQSFPQMKGLAKLTEHVERFHRPN